MNLTLVNVLWCSLIRCQTKCWFISAERWSSWPSESADECATTHLPPNMDAVKCAFDTQSLLLHEAATSERASRFAVKFTSILGGCVSAGASVGASASASATDFIKKKRNVLS